MPIYTKTGDKGETSLFGGKRISKSDELIDAYGTIDELTSILGLVITRITNKQDKFFLTDIQRDLYTIMAHLSGAKSPIEFLNDKIKKFEQEIDDMQSKLPKLTRFILPGGTETGAWFQIARAVSRRAERRVVGLPKNHPHVIQYLNRLSDLLFMFARKYSKGKEIIT